MKIRATISAAAMIALAGQALATPPQSSISNNWELTFGDEFDQLALDTSAWVAMDSCTGTGTTQICRYPANVSVNGGILSLMTTENTIGGDATYATGRIDTLASFNAGYFEARVRTTAASGINNSVFSTNGVSFGPIGARLPDGSNFNAWNMYTGFDDYALPTPSGATGNQYEHEFGEADLFPGALDLSAGFITYGLQWTEANELLWYADGDLIDRYQIPDSAEFHNAIRWAIGSAINDANTYGMVDAGTAPGSSMDIEYFRAYTTSDQYFGADNFDYSGSLGGKNGGEDWGGAWSVESGAVNIAGDGQSLSIPPALTGLPTTTGGRLVTSQLEATRAIDTAFDVAADSGEDRYVAVLMRKSENAEVRFNFRRSSDSISRWGFGVLADESVFAEMLNTTGSLAGVFPTDETVLVVSYLDSNSGGNETVYMKVFREGDQIPTSPDAIEWDVSNTINSTVFMNQLRIAVSGGEAEIDEIRLGYSLDEVLQPTGTPAVTEAFNYTGSLSGQNGGSGFTSAWSVGSGSGAIDGMSLANIDSPSFEARTGFGSRVVLDEGAALRLFHNVSMGTFGMNTQQDDTYFMSFLVNQGNGSDFDIEFADLNGNYRWNVGLTDGKVLSAGITSVDSVNLGGESLPTATGGRIDRNGDSDMHRELAEPIAMFETRSRWFSAIIEKSDTASVGFYFLDASGNIRWSMRMGDDEAMTLDTFGPDGVAANAVPVDEPFIFLARLDTTGTTDTLRGKIFRAGDPVPANEDSIVWDAEHSGTTNVTLTQLIIETIDGSGQLDEIKMGDSLSDVLGSGTPSLSESFDYSAGALAGNNGGTGWSSPWSVFGFSDWNVATPGFDYPALAEGGFVDEPVLVLARFQARSTGTQLDGVRVKVFRQGDSIPVNSNAINWDLEVEDQSTGVFLDRVRIRATDSGSGGSGTTQFDELAIGTTLASVLGEIPEAEGGCNRADIALPYHVLNFADVQSFLGAFGSGLPAADLAAPAGVYNFADVQTFLGLFGAGC